MVAVVVVTVMVQIKKRLRSLAVVVIDVVVSSFVVEVVVTGVDVGAE